MTKKYIIVLVCSMIICAGLLAWSSNNMTAVANTTDEIAMQGFSPNILANNVKYQVVNVEMYNTDADEYLDFAGTGFVYDSHHIITAYHVVEEAVDDPNIIIEITTEYGIACDGYVIGSHEDLDVAVISLDWDGLRCYEWENDWEIVVGHDLIPVSVSSQRVDIGDWVVGVGYTDAYWPTYTLGIISRSDVKVDYVYADVIVHDAALGVGSSGAPLYDLYGNVIGMTIGGWFAEDRIRLAHTVPIDAVYDAVDLIIKYSN